MICELCKGKGWVQGQAPDIPTACPACGGKGFIEQTNEDWFCGLSTEEKAKWLSQRSQILYDCGQRDVFPKIMYEEDWEWWLKQPHHNEVEK